jgi:hypothetical protein
VKIFSVPSGSVVGVVGGTKLANGEPSLSPDGTQVVFTRNSAKDSGPGPAIWTAAADGSHLKQLERRGDGPLWSPAGNRIAYLAPTGPGRSACRDEEGAQAAEAPASVSVVECRLVAEFATAAGGLAAAAPLVLSNRPVASADRRREAAPGARLLTPRTKHSAYAACPDAPWEIAVRD